MSQSQAVKKEEPKPAGTEEAGKDSSPTVEGQAEPPSFSNEIDSFLMSVESLKSCFPFLIKTSHKAVRVAAADAVKYGKYVKGKYGAREVIEGEKKRELINFPHSWELNKILKSISDAVAIVDILPRSLLTALVSAFDVYIGRLIRTYYYTKPNAIKGLNSKIPLSKLLTFRSISDAQDYAIEKKVEGVLRKSHTFHFQWLERQLGISLTTGLESWPAFVELTERRNLFVHADGVVGSQYLAVCDKHNVAFPEGPPSPGTKLDCSPDYFDKACRVVLEIGIKLGHVMWRHLAPGDLDEANTDYNNLVFELISRDHYELAIELISFIMNNKKAKISQETTLMIRLNWAQAYKWSGNEDRCKKILSEAEWDVLAPRFRIGEAVLMERYSEASQHMKSIGPDGEIKKKHYREWPIFRKFVDTKEFQDTSQELFNGPFEWHTPFDPNQIEAEIPNTTDDGCEYHI